jgi:hypothetical protein
MKHNNRFWPLGDSFDEEIYESLSWDLPGFKVRKAPKFRKSRSRLRYHGKR